MADRTWADAVAPLTGLRTKAETLAALLKKYGGDHIARGQLTYSDAKSGSDAVIAGLIVALSAGQEPASLNTLQENLRSSVSGLVELREMVVELLPKTTGHKDITIDFLKGAIEQLLKPLSDAVAALYNNFRADNELTRKTIQTQLEAARWPDFADVKAADAGHG
jgi:hypothetical protein